MSRPTRSSAFAAFLGKPPGGYFGGIAAYDDMHRACNVASNEASRAGGVGHVTNRLQKTTTAAQLVALEAATVREVAAESVF